MKKICTVCNRELEAEQDFNWKYKKRDIHHTRCKNWKKFVRVAVKKETLKGISPGKTK